MESVRAMRERWTMSHTSAYSATRLRRAPKWRCSRRQSGGSREALADCIEETTGSNAARTRWTSRGGERVLKLERERIDVASLLRSVAELYALVEREIDRDRSRSGASVEVQADPTRLRQMCELSTTRSYTPVGGKVSLARRPRRPVCIPYATGLALPRRSGKIWQRLYAEIQRSQRGSLGLSVVKALVEPRRPRDGGQSTGRRGVHGRAAGGGVGGPGSGRAI